jgi:hypothetical protein
MPTLSSLYGEDPYRNFSPSQIGPEATATNESVRANLEGLGQWQPGNWHPLQYQSARDWLERLKGYQDPSMFIGNYDQFVNDPNNLMARTIAQEMGGYQDLTDRYNQYVSGAPQNLNTAGLRAYYNYAGKPELGINAFNRMMQNPDAPGRFLANPSMGFNGVMPNQAQTGTPLGTQSGMSFGDYARSIGQAPPLTQAVGMQRPASVNDRQAPRTTLTGIMGQPQIPGQIFPTTRASSYGSIWENPAVTSKVGLPLVAMNPQGNNYQSSYANGLSNIWRKTGY